MLTFENKFQSTSFFQLYHYRLCVNYKKFVKILIMRIHSIYICARAHSVFVTLSTTGLACKIQHCKLFLQICVNRDHFDNVVICMQTDHIVRSMRVVSC